MIGIRNIEQERLKFGAWVNVVETEQNKNKTKNKIKTEKRNNINQLYLYCEQKHRQIKLKRKINQEEAILAFHKTRGRDDAMNKGPFHTFLQHDIGQ